MTGNVIPFPPLLRVARTPSDAVLQEDATLVLVDHDGRTCLLPELIGRLSPDKLREIETTYVRSGQAVCDEVVLRWPALAKEIAAGCQASP